MKVIATNISEPKTISWRGKEVKTGIFKYPTSEPLYLGTEDVRKDAVIDRKYHGGEHKACYLFSADYYSYWKHLYPDLDWNWGMFGENLTVLGMDENLIRIGDIYKIGTSIVQLSEPREPCYKLGAKFGDQAVLKQFIHHAHCGTYVRVLEEGEVAVNDRIELIKQSDNPLTIAAYFKMLYATTKDTKTMQLAANNEALAKEKREKWRTLLSES